MKTLFKILGIATGIYGLMGLGCLIGIGSCDDYYNNRFDKNCEIDKKAKDVVEANIELWNDLNKRKNKKSSKKKSEVLSAYARKWAKEGYSSEEIKRGLENLKKELD